MDCIICRYGELALKGKNRFMFEDRLVYNIRDCLNKNRIEAEIKKVRGRILVFTNDLKALSVLPDVFGLVSVSPAVVADSLPEAIKERVIDYVRDAVRQGKPTTFRISTKRTNKSFPLSSNETDILLGDAVGDMFNLKAKMKGADLDVGVEIHDNAFIFHETIPCFGGLPLGMTGNVACILENDAGLAAAWLMMKRGCIVFPIGWDETDIDLLMRFSYGHNTWFTQIKDLSDIDGFAEKNGCMAVVIGDRLEGFEPDKYKDVKTALLTPIIAYDDDMLSALLERIR